MLATLLLMSTWQIPAENAHQRVLVLDMRTDGDVQLGAVLANEIATVLGRGGQLEVLSSEDLRRLADVAAGREAVGCGDDASCLAELGAAMGARYIVSGALGKVGTSTIVQLSLFDVDRARSIARESGDAPADGVAATTRALSERLRQALVPEEPVRVPVLPLAVAGGGGALALAGVAVAAIAYPTVVDTTLSSAGGPEPKDRQTAQLVGAVAVVAAGTGLAAVGAGALLYALGVGE